MAIAHDKEWCIQYSDYRVLELKYQALESRHRDLVAAAREMVRCVFYKREITVEEYDKALEVLREALKDESIPPGEAPK